MPEGIKVDWTFRVSDVIKMVSFAIVCVLAYAHMDARVTKIEEQSEQTARILSEHIEKQAEATQRLNELLDRLKLIIEEFPPHRHEKGQIIYPHDGKLVTP